MEKDNTDYPETRHPDSEHWWATPDPEARSIVTAPWKQDVDSIFADRYKILKKLGQGGMGAVYQVHDANLDRIVALKIPSLAGAGPHFVKRFIREARAMARLIKQNNICKVIDVVNPGDGVPYLTMEFIEGVTLSDKLRREPQPAVAEVVSIVKVLATALGVVHSLDIIHRDLKPANIMIRGDGEPIIMDFGLARRDGDERITLTNTAMGTLPYMSPEQIEGRSEEISSTSDIYSLGVIFYEMLAGRKPFTGNEIAMVGLILHADPTPPSVYRPGLDRRIEAICLKALAKDPKARHASMADLAGKLEAITEPLPIASSETPTSTEVDRRYAHLAPVKPDPTQPSVRLAEVPKPVKGDPVPDRGFVRNWIGLVMTALVAAVVVVIFLTRTNRENPVGPGTIAVIPDRSPDKPDRPGDQPDPKPVESPPVIPFGPGARPEFVSRSTGMVLVAVAPGTFLMGSDVGEDSERPRHKVVISRSYDIGKFEVTQAEYSAVIRHNPSRFLTDSRDPVELVSWLDAVRFCNALSLMDGLKAFYLIDEDHVSVPDWSVIGYRLPTEAEWEFACRAGRSGEFGSSDDGADIATQAWFSDNSKVNGYFETHHEHPDSDRPHPLSLHNMQGNVWEWCWDWYGRANANVGILVDPVGPVSGEDRVKKGGCYSSKPKFLRPSARDRDKPTVKSPTIGFRVVLNHR